MLMDNCSSVVHSKENDVEHEGHMDAPVDAVTIQVETIDDQLRQEDHGKVAPMEVGDWDGGIRKEFSEWGEPSSKLWHG